MSTAARGGGRGRGGRGRGGHSGAAPARDYGGNVTGGSGNRGRGASRGGARAGSKAKKGEDMTTSTSGGGYGEPQPGMTCSDGSRIISGEELRAIQAGRNGGASVANSNNTSIPSAPSTGTVEQRYRTLKSNREHERKAAIKNGFLADPDKPRKLKDAITPVGTCQDMCSEFERVSRIYERDVWAPEHDPQSVKAGSKRVPMESRMVKKFRRAAAGIDEQLPSDLRPPLVLQKTVDYLLNSLLSESKSLADVHHFIWDRARAVRNDFSIQQLTKVPDVRVAIECYERIARFHIVSMHKLAMPQKPYESYEWFQEREQLDKTLLSLIQYYDDNRARYRSPNEAEFRAYCIIFQIHAHVPDMEHRIQEWPEDIMWNSRVQTAMKLYAAAGTVRNYQGPMRPESTFKTAQQNWMGFWEIVKSPQVSYLMGCVAEVYFNQIRETAMQCIFRTFKQGGATRCRDWTVQDLVPALGFDTEDEVKSYIQAHRFQILTREDGKEYWDINGIAGKVLPSPSGLRSQYFSYSLVEHKRCGRTLPAVIKGISIKAARAAGMVDPPGAQTELPKAKVETTKGQSLFITSDSESESEKANKPSMAPPTRPANANEFGSPAPFVEGTASAEIAAMMKKSIVNAFSAFGKPSTPTPDNASATASPKLGTFGAPSSSTASVASAPATSTPAATSVFSGFQNPPSSGFGAPAASSTPTATSVFSGLSKPPSSTFGAPAATASPFSSFGKAAPAPPVTTQSPAPFGSSGFTAASTSPGLNSSATNFSEFGQPPASTAPAPANPFADSLKAFGTPASMTPAASSPFGLPKSTTPASSPFAFPSSAGSAQASKPAAAVEVDSPKTTQAPASNSNGNSPAFAAPTGGSSTPFSLFPQTQTTTPTVDPATQKTFTTTEQGKAPAFSFGSEPSSTTPSGEPEKANAFGFNASQLAGNKPSKHVTFASPATSTTPTTFSTSTPLNSASSLGQSIAQNSPSFTPQSTPPTSFSFGNVANAAAPPSLGSFNPPKAAEAPKAAQESRTSSLSGVFSQPAPQQPVASPLPTQNQAPAFTPPLQNPASTFTPPVQAAPIAFTPPSQTPPVSSTNAVVPSASEQRPTLLQKHQTHAVLDMAAEQLFTAPFNGVLAQYLEFTTGDIVKELMQQVEAEKAAATADEFRRHTLATRYGMAWKRISWTNRLRRRGKDSRVRRRAHIAALTQANAPARKISTADVFGRTASGTSTRPKPFSASTPLSASVNVFSRSNKENERKGVQGSPPADDFLDPVPLAQLAKGKSKDSGRPSKAQAGGDKQAKGHIDGKNRASKASAKRKNPEEPKPAEPEPRKRRVPRKSWLEENVMSLYSENVNNARISTTKTDYFRLRALGIDANELRTTRKRNRVPEDEGEDIGLDRSGESSTPPERKRRGLLAARRRNNIRSSITPLENERPSSAPHATRTNSAKTSEPKTREQIDAEDDARIARLRALTKQMVDGTEWFSSTREKEERRLRSSQSSHASGFRSSEEMRRSFGAAPPVHRSTYDPLASSYSQFRRSTFGEQDVPSELPNYWYRESRFLPRSEYGGARWLAKIQEQGKKDAEKAKGKTIEAEGGVVSQTRTQTLSNTAPSAVPTQENGTQSQTVGHNTQNSTMQPPSSSARMTNGTSAPPTVPRPQQNQGSGAAPVDTIEILSSDEDEAPAPAVAATTAVPTTNGIKSEPEDDDAPGAFTAQDVDAGSSQGGSEMSDADEEDEQVADEPAGQQYDEAFFAQGAFDQGMPQYNEAYDAYAPGQGQMYYPEYNGGPHNHNHNQWVDPGFTVGQGGDYGEDEVIEAYEGGDVEEDDEMSDVIDEDDDELGDEDSEMSGKEGEGPGPGPGPDQDQGQGQAPGSQLQNMGNSVEDAIEL